jgi:hypothetical protein
MKLKTILLLASVAFAGSIQGQQTVGFIAGLPDTTASPVFAPADATAASLPLTITLATGPDLASAEGLRGLSGADLFNALSDLTGTGAIVGFRSQAAAWNTPVTMPGVAETFSAASQLWVFASTAPINALTPGDYVAILGAPTWQADDPGAAIKPPVIMNTSLAVGDPLVLLVGEFGSIVPVTLAVPEPSTYALLGGVFALGFVMWRRRRS